MTFLSNPVSTSDKDISIGDREFSFFVKSVSTGTCAFEISERVQNSYNRALTKLGRKIFAIDKINTIADAEKEIKQNFFKSISLNPIPLQAVVKIVHKPFIDARPKNGTEYSDEQVLKNILSNPATKAALNFPVRATIPDAFSAIDAYIARERNTYIMSSTREPFPIIEYIGVWINFDADICMFTVKPMEQYSPTIMAINRYNSIEEYHKQNGITN